MAQVCPRCNSTVGDDLTRCSSCGADLDPCRTIPPARPKQIAPAKSASPVRKVSAGEPSEYGDDREAETPPSPKPLKKVKARPPAAQPPRPSSGSPPVSRASKPSAAPAYPTPPGSTGEMAYAAPPVQAHQHPGPAPIAPAQPEARGGLRGWMIKMLGGTPAQSAPAPAPAAVTPPYYGQVPPGTPPPHPGMTPGTPPGMYPPGAMPQAPAAVYHPAAIPGAHQTPPAGWPQPQQPAPGQGFSLQGPGSGDYAAFPHLDTPPNLIDPLGVGSDDPDGKTQFVGGVNLDKLKIPKYTFTLQILDNQGQWRDFGPIHANGLNVGRAKNSAEFPGLASMAVRHMKLRYERTTLVVEDLGSINGVYVRVTQPTELIDGMRFRVGNQTIEFHEPGEFTPATPLAGEDGEEYCSRDLEPLAYLDLIRPNGQAGLRFPITRADPTVIGREGPNTHIALTSDNSVSGMHARVYRKEGQFVLEDLKSRNGTFIHVLGSAKVSSGDVLLAGQVLFRVVDHIGG